MLILSEKLYQRISLKLSQIAREKIEADLKRIDKSHYVRKLKKFRNTSTDR